MSHISDQVYFDAFGKPEEVLQTRKVKLCSIKRGEVLVKILAAPINPADLNFIEGNYGVKPELPAVPGMEGCGEVIESTVDEFSASDKVLFLSRVGTWQSHVVVSADELMLLPKEIDPIQASMLKVNPATAWRLLVGYSSLSAGDWVVQNAANSGVGRCVIQLAKQQGIRTVNLVRREELISELKELGADVVLLDRKGVVEEALAATGGKRPLLACNAVGGDSALRLMDVLGEEGVHVTYGAMSRRSLKVPNKFLIFKRIQLHGLWITKYLESVEREEIAELYNHLGNMIISGALKQKIHEEFIHANRNNAVQCSAGEARNGKVVFVYE